VKAAIQLKSVSKTYIMGEEEVKALRSVDLEIMKGDLFAIQGPSGSGKSTAMHMVGALDVPDSGEIYINGEAVSSFSESELAILRGKSIGFVFQQFNLIQTLTALENVMLPMIFQGINKDERKARASKLLTDVGLAERMEHRPTQLSGGQQQRVAIARSLANDPDIILADEPTGNLDSVTGKQVLAMLKELNKQGKTVVMITHDNKLTTEAKKVAYLKDGQIISLRKKR
jgi:putative ABC transport system ATP-binding protein